VTHGLGQQDVKLANERLVLNYVRLHPGVGRRAVAEATGLAPASLTAIVQRLSAHGLIREGGAQALGRGRPVEPLHLRPEARSVIGVEITTQAAAIARAHLDGAIVSHRVVAAPRSAAQYLERIHGAIRDSCAGGVMAVAVSVPGNLDPKTGVVTHATNLRWHRLDVIERIRRQLNVPFFWENNSNLAAWGERWFASEPLDDYVFITLRDGLGTGLLFQGRIWSGAHFRAGEFGHWPLVPRGRACPCGRRGCWERYASDAGLRAEYGPAADSLAIAQAALDGDRQAQRALDRTVAHLAAGLGPVIIGLDPAGVIFDDFAAVAWARVEPQLWRHLRRQVPAAWLHGVELRPARQAAGSALCGAIALALSRYFEGETGGW
jgi:predicted NBD/HSP70 family sugar kinase